MKFNPTDLTAHFSNNYQPNKDSIINIDGYYLTEGRTDYEILIFYPNGCVNKVYSIKKVYVDSIGLPTTNFDEQIESSCSHGIYNIIDGYIIVDNPLILQYVITTCNYERYKFEIIDNNTIRLVEENSRISGGFRKMDRVYRFVKASPLPPESDLYDLQIKWMWENEDEWKAYKRQREEAERIRKHAE